MIESSFTYVKMTASLRLYVVILESNYYVIAASPTFITITFLNTGFISIGTIGILTGGSTKVSSNFKGTTLWPSVI